MAKDFAKAIEIATETEDAAKVAKDIVHGAKPKPVHKVGPRPFHKQQKQNPRQASQPATVVVMKTTKHHNVISKTLCVTFVVVKDISQKYAGRSSLQMLEPQRSQLTLYMKSKQ